MNFKKLMLFAAASLTSVLLLAGCTTKYEGDIVSFEGNADIKITTGDEAEEVEEETPEADVEENNDTDAQADTKESEESECELEDGIYLADFNTDSSMFHVNEMCDGKGELKVENGVMTIHISLPSKSILNLYSGLAEDAQKDGAVLLEPTVDTIDYNDGTTEDVHGFDIPVPYLDEEFDVALIGTKGKWYDHKVSVSNPVAKGEAEASGSEETVEEAEVNEGDYTIEVRLEGGSGKATITTPCKINVTDGKTIATIEWSSPNYDYMLVGDEKYLPVNTEGNSVFEIPVNLDEPNTVIADTVAMSKPHEIEYTLTFDKTTIK